MMMKPMYGKKPKQPKIIALRQADINMFKGNAQAITQLLAVISNNADLSELKGAEEQLQNAVKFLDDMVFLFGKMESSDGAKFEK